MRMSSSPHGTTPRTLFVALLIPALALGVTACDGAGDRPGSADAVEMAEAGVAGMMEKTVADAALFDSISWTTRAAAMDRGATVYAYSCRKCHGDTGAGDGGFQREGRTVRPPSFLEADWRFAHDAEGLRRMIHGGGERSMPHWGEAGLTPRDVDAVARYITRGLWAQGD